jgi:hypothetical protein
LPIPAEIDARLVLHDERHHAINLEAVRIFSVILAPCHLLREADQVRTSNMVMMADLRAAHAGEKRFGVVGASVVERVGFLMVDALHDEAAMQRAPGPGLVGVNFCAPSDLAADEVKRLIFGAEHAGERYPVALADHHDALPPARLVLPQPAIAPVLAEIGGLDVAAEITAVDLGLLAFAADFVAGLVRMPSLPASCGLARSSSDRRFRDRATSPACSCP